LEKMTPIVSVVICVKNGEKTIEKCLESLINQTFKDFEIILVDDYSTDTTSKIINGFKDERIKCYKNREWFGIAKSRNIGMRHAVGKYVFCTDADCTVSKDWISEGLNCFAEDCIGVEGRIIYVSETYQPAFSDYVMDNKTGGNYMTGNVAYRKDILEAAGGLNELMLYLSDRELGLRIAKKGKICYNKNMIVIHPHVRMTPSRLFKITAFQEDRVYLYKKLGDRVQIVWRIVNPFNLAKIIFPGLVIVSLFANKFRGKEDYRLVPYTYVSAILERIHIWKACAKYRVFLV
jgi:glycosyltransferase involved in cell wall biosynthesis